MPLRIDVLTAHAAKSRTIVAVSVGIALASLVGFLIPTSPVALATLLGALALAVAFLLFLRFPRLAIYLLVLLIPLQYLTRLGNEATAIRYLGWLVFAAWGLGNLAQKASFRHMVHGPLFKMMFLFLAWCFVSLLWSPLSSWRVSFFTYVQLAGMVVIMVDLVDSQDRLEAMLLCLHIGTILAAGVALYEYFQAQAGLTPWSRALGGFGDGNYSSAAYMFVLPYSLFLINHRSGWRRILGVASVPLLLTAVAVTASRVGLLAVPLWLLLQFRGFARQDRKIPWLLAAACLTFLAISYWPWANISYRYATAWTGGAPEDLGGRIALWNISLDSFVQRPLSGYGLATGLGTWQRFVPHNLFLQVAVRLGLPGLLAILGIILVTWRSISQAYARAVSCGSARAADLLRAVRNSMLLFLFFSLALDTATLRLLWLTFALGVIVQALFQDAPSRSSSLNTKMARATASPSPRS
jgi:O-antigen ligase